MVDSTGTRSTGTRDNGTRADPTALRAQPALTTSTGAIWLIFGGLFTAIALALLLAMMPLPGAHTVATVAAITVAVLYVGMIVAHATIAAGPRRLTALAVGMLLIAGVSLVSVVIVTATAWSGVPF